MEKFDDLKFVQEKNSNRRKKTDIISLGVFICGLISWILVAASMVVVFKAQPERGMVIDEWKHKVVRTVWDYELLSQNKNIMIAMVLISVLGLFLNSFRMKRKGDHYNRFLIATAAIGLLGFLAQIIFT